MPFEKIMHEFKEGTLHSGSKKGPKVSDRSQALAIALSYARKEGKKKKKGDPPPKHTAKHPGFAAVSSKIASQEGVSQEAADRILAAKSRGASVKAKKANPRLGRVKG